VPPLLEQAPPAQHLIRNHHQRLLVQPRRTHPTPHPAASASHSQTPPSFAAARERSRASSRWSSPHRRPLPRAQRSPACAQAHLGKHVPCPKWQSTSPARKATSDCFLSSSTSDGKVLASGGDDIKIILWDPKKGKRLAELNVCCSSRKHNDVDYCV
jgi:WD40 repeat protein